MAEFSGSECAFCCFMYEVTCSATVVWRCFWMKFAKNPPSRSAIVQWYFQFMEMGCVNHRNPGRGRPLREQVETGWDASRAVLGSPHAE
jgi:hypothetical protein